MAYLLEGFTIKRPTSMKVTRVGQYAQHKTLSGAVGRDYFGSDKLVFELHYDNISVTDYTTILSIYDDYKNLGARYFDTTGEAVVYGTLVHIDVNARQFSVYGSSYLSDFILLLTEA